jgi:hypothetical protein
MRKSLFLLFLFLYACGGSDGDGFIVTTEPIRHVPEISSLNMSPDLTSYMEGNGSIVVTVEVTFRDAGQDLRALRVQMPDSTIIEFSESFTTETGTFTEDFAMPTTQVGVSTVEIWLVDEAGDSSIPVTAELQVLAKVQTDDWTNRLSGFPYSLSDVTWTGDDFIAVGTGGTVLTSADGIDWVAKQSGLSEDLNAIASYGSDIFAVGDEIVLISTDHGASWTVKDMPIEADLRAVAINSSQVVVGGNLTMISEDRGDTWRAVDSWPDEDFRMNDIVYRDGMFVATTFTGSREGAWVTVSSDGNVWNEIAVSDELAFLHTIVHDDSQFISGGVILGGGGAVFTSPDGFNWTQLEIPTPILDVFYTGAAWSGSKLVLAGPWSCGYLGGSCGSPYDAPPVGLSTTDGGVNWNVFNIDGDYESWGLAWGNGQFVSVGGTRDSHEGAIYTAE